MHRGFSITRRGLLAAVASASVVPVARAAHEVRPWPGGSPLPPLTLTDLEGRAWNLARDARPMLLNFWATWCEPCRAEMPSLEALLARREAEGLRVLAVNFKEGAPAVNRFLAATPLALPIVLDPDGAVARAFGVRVLPSTILVDRLGRPRGTVLGEIDWTGDAARALVEPLFNAGRRS